MTDADPIPGRPASKTPAPPSPASPVLSLPAGGDSGRDCAWWVALSDERDLALRLRLAAWRNGYRLGREHGWKQGYEAACADQEAAWHEVAGRVARGANQPTFAELERRRWGPGGREHFADPRPGDYPGRA
jgi:hypothetical protein